MKINGNVCLKYEKEVEINLDKKNTDRNEIFK